MYFSLASHLCSLYPTFAPVESRLTDSMSTLSIDAKIALITRGLQEVMGGDKAIATMRALMEDYEKKNDEEAKAAIDAGQTPGPRKHRLKIYWGTATTGAPHIAYYVPMSKIADFLRADCDVTILFADLHAYLDNQKAPWDLLQQRTDYYEVVIKSMLESIGVPLDHLRFIRGSSFQLERKYTLDMYKLTAMTSERNSKKAGAEVVRQVESALLSSMVYPLLQALDEEYLGCDVQFGGVDQRKIFTYAEGYLPAIGYKKRIHLMNPMVPSLSGGKGNKMSSSDPNSKIDLLDSAAVVKSKIKKAFAAEGIVEGNGLLAFAQRVLFPLSADGSVVVEREEKNGGNLTFKSYEEMEAAYASAALHPGDLKNFVMAGINKLIDPIRVKFQSQELQDLVKRAYPVGEKHEAPAAPVINLDDDGNTPAASEAEQKANPEASTSTSTSTAKPAAAAGGAESKIDGRFERLELRVGKMTNVRDHPKADALFLTDVDIGAAAKVQVVTNLRKTMTAAELEGKQLVFLCNMKPSKMKDEVSSAMIMGCKSSDGSVHDLVEPPSGAKPGELLHVEGTTPSTAAFERANEKVIGKVFSQLGSTAEKQMCFNGSNIVCASGKVMVPKIANAVFAFKE